MTRLLPPPLVPLQPRAHIPCHVAFERGAHARTRAHTSVLARRARSAARRGTWCWGWLADGVRRQLWAALRPMMHPHSAPAPERAADSRARPNRHHQAAQRLCSQAGGHARGQHGLQRGGGRGADRGPALWRRLREAGACGHGAHARGRPMAVAAAADCVRGGRAVRCTHAPVCAGGGPAAVGALPAGTLNLACMTCKRPGLRLVGSCWPARRPLVAEGCATGGGITAPYSTAPSLALAAVLAGESRISRQLTKQQLRIPSAPPLLRSAAHGKHDNGNDNAVCVQEGGACKHTHTQHSLIHARTRSVGAIINLELISIQKGRLQQAQPLCTPAGAGRTCTAAQSQSLCRSRQYNHQWPARALQLSS